MKKNNRIFNRMIYRVVTISSVQFALCDLPPLIAGIMIQSPDNNNHRHHPRCHNHTKCSDFAYAWAYIWISIAPKSSQSHKYLHNIQFFYYYASTYSHQLFSPEAAAAVALPVTTVTTMVFPCKSYYIVKALLPFHKFTSTLSPRI